MSTTSAPHPARIAATLRTLYAVRFVFQLVWALVLILTASAGLGPVSVTLLLLYPLFDVVAAIVDHRASRGTGPSPLLSVNMGLSLLAAIGLVFAVASGIPAVMVVWGLWAITAGAVQLVVALRRRRLGGQWPMILSGGISVLAGVGFLAGSANSESVAGVGGYAILGAVFFLVSAIRLQRAAKLASAGAERA
ncbi:Uncharacterized membrane protein HdeD, DUF308 family [Curtobacterium sp. 314Chir4.1]|uniref:hypothetical protein n=1 Tax=Curtobacterium sp. 314Chir4.1 TaxID=1279028 RepID=UPI000BDCBBB3|nr:hypothetical protein [Curtobacterium sp. 314Chir4.1]SOC88709.1 Uncharacterized membrane protein HdeD, DUF308 family [Curtobacterium sp. 314Chir4.1]